jgi:hypothetical protein
MQIKFEKKYKGKIKFSKFNSYTVGFNKVPGGVCLRFLGVFTQTSDVMTQVNKLADTPKLVSQTFPPKTPHFTHYFSDRQMSEF